MSPSLETSPTEETWGMGSKGSVQEEWALRSGQVALALAGVRTRAELDT